MAYETIDRLKTYMQKKIDAIVTGEKVTFNINAHQLLDEINEMERKAKAFDELVKLYPQKEEIPSDEFFDEMGHIIKEDE
ncbi:hypothetical protein PYL56_07865 [Staphylococcus succinus]|uniref:hypothetical protein n=1 Tax=Staphylococcus succinus TaxID=61015 RepID=UPI002480A8E7|nr:hypothetical protein [Staphylococcus succinus]MDH9161282.1 hypothetical protein [Staphylococcus succinus]